MNPLQEAIYGLVEKFVECQNVPFEVIQKYRPHLVDSSKHRSTNKAYLSATQTGVWGESNEWEYRLHGGGCHVIHVDTREVIGWDAPNLHCFDPYWFVDLVHWHIKHSTQSKTTPLLASLVDMSEADSRRSIFEILDQLYKLGKLQYYLDSTNKYELVSDCET